MSDSSECIANVVTNDALQTSRYNGSSPNTLLQLNRAFVLFPLIILTFCICVCLHLKCKYCCCDQYHRVRGILIGPEIFFWRMTCDLRDILHLRMLGWSYRLARLKYSLRERQGSNPKGPLPSASRVTGRLRTT